MKNLRRNIRGKKKKKYDDKKAKKTGKYLVENCPEDT